MDALRRLNAERLGELLTQLHGFGALPMTANDPEFITWRERTHHVLSELFGDMPYPHRFEGLRFCEPRVRIVRGGGPVEDEWLPIDQARFNRDAYAAEALLQDALRELTSVGVGSNDAPITALEALEVAALLHPTIATIAMNRFAAKEYADAAESAMKAINERVKTSWTAAGKPEKDGKALMLSMFSLSQPIVRFGDLSTESGRNMQEGYMHIFAGSMQAIRNPKAHGFVSISPERCAQFLVLASLLMFRLDEAGCP